MCSNQADHYENINSSDPNVNMYWGSINPIFYNNWDYDANEPILNLCEPDGDVNQDGIISNVFDKVKTKSHACDILNSLNN